MRHILLILLITLLNIPLDSIALKPEYNYIGRTLAEALADFCKRNPDIKVSFIYDELEDYRVKESVRSDNPLEILKTIVALNPVSVTEDGNDIYIEAMQRGRYRYTGRTVDALSGEPVGFATVMVLNPKDSTTVTYGITDEHGNFSIPCDRKKILARISSVGYHTVYLPNPSFSMGDVRMNVQSVELRGITARADTRYVQSDRVVYIPSTREKRAADNGLSLLRFMSIPSIRVSAIGNSVSTLSGGEVALFIDYARASDEDIKGMRPEDVKRVEVLDYPADPRFEGVAYAINFIMAKYEYGGYTSLSAQQGVLFPDWGYYSLSSKFSKGKMTYDIFTGYDRFNSSHENSASKTFYDLDGGEVERTLAIDKSEVENNEMYLSARVKYASEATMVSNQFSIRDNEFPHSNRLEHTAYNPALYPSGLAESKNKRSSLTPSWNGNWQFSFPRSLQLVVTPSAKYSRNTSRSFFSEDNIENISNVKEDEWSANLGVSITKKFSQHSLTFRLNGDLGGDRLRYTGSNPAEITYHDEAVGAYIRGNLRFGKLRLNPSVKFYYKWTSFGDEHYTQPIPGYYISGGINFNRKHQLSFSSEMSNWTVGVAYRSPNTVVQNLLDAVKGNPKLKSWLYNSADVGYTWLPLQWLNLSAFVDYKRHIRPMDYIFYPTEINGREMMLRTYIKEGYFQIITEGIGATVRLFDNSLTLQGDVKVASYRKGGRMPYQRTVVNSSLSANYYFGNFYLRGYFEFGEKETTRSERYYDRPCYYLLSGGWGIKGWRISVDLKNIFRSDYLKGESYMDYGNYRAYNSYYGIPYRRNIMFNISYTFKYGKKVREENIDRGSSSNSGIVF